MVKVFAGVRYALSNTLNDTLAGQLATLLDANSGTPTLPSDEKLTHYISNTLPATQPIDELPEESDAYIVTSFWVERSVILAARQDESGFSPDPSLIFSGVIATATDLSYADLDVLSAGISALGGQWRSALTKDITHLFALSTGSAKYETSQQFKGDMDLKVVVPHWFDDCVRIGQQIEPGPYEWPDPKVFAPTWDREEAGKKSKLRSPQKLSPEKSAMYASVFQNGPPPEPKNVWKGFKLMLDLEMNESQFAAHEADITREGGVVVHEVEEADILIMRYRSGPNFVKAYRLNKTIGTLAWMWFVRATSRISRPTEQLLHYPVPYTPIDGFSEHKITITNYTGPDREYLKKLITILGAQFTADMTGNNTVVIAASMEGQKTHKALSWSIPVVNHVWLEDCFIQWRHVAQAHDKYTYFPPGVDFGKLLGKKGLGRSGYDPSELELIEKEVVAQEAGEPMQSNNDGDSQLPATGQSAREVEDVVMADGDMSIGAFLDHDMQMDVDDEDPSPKKKAPPKPKRAAAKPKPVPKSKPVSKAKPASRNGRSATEADEDDAPPNAGSENENEQPPPESPTITRLRVKRGVTTKKKQTTIQSDDDEPVVVVSSSKTKSPAKKSVPQDDDDESDAPPKAERKSTVKRTYGSSSKRQVPADETDLEATPPPKSPSKSSLSTPKRTVSVLVPTYDQVKSASKNSPSKTGRTVSFRAQAHETASASPKRSRVMKSKPGPSSGSPPPSVSPPPLDKRTRKTSDTRRPETPAGPSNLMGTPATLTRSPSRRSAATKATQRLREEIMPDVLNFAKELKSGNIKSMWDKSRASAKKTKELLKGKKRLSMGDGDDEEGEPDEEEQPEKKKRRKSATGAKVTGKGKGKAEAEESGEEEVEESVSEQPVKKVEKATTATGKKSGQISKKDPASIVIMTTQVTLSDDVQKVMTKLGVKFTTKPSECTHLVAKSIVRTEKFLCAMAAGPIIVTDKWVHTCVRTKHILVEDDFLLHDAQGEAKYSFTLADALERARTSGGKLFAGMTFLLTPRLPMEVKILKAVVLASGGQTTINSTPTQRTMKNNTTKFVISCPADVSIWRGLAEQGCHIYSPELLLNSALRQEIDWDNPSNKVDGSY
ncbi:hypothetical protein EUX98_g5551 [Antrodiella citrinella]|uniref:BRCT domain-containing protein n=1 Tax=Antrodiella citrinella TaxID=2447956 RepID=A0A4V3XIC4_9APHY|nr:hypothetical protein EUX98_g5551 [Antrodiella citrinella]